MINARMKIEYVDVYIEIIGFGRGFRHIICDRLRPRPEPVLSDPSLRARLSTCLQRNSGHLKITLFPKRQKKFRGQWPFLSANGL